MKRNLLSAFACCACIVIAAGCTKTNTAQGLGGRNAWTIPGTLRIGIPDEPDSLNPMFAHTAEADEVDELIYAPLFRYDQNGEFYPELATALPTYANGGITKDNRTITVHLRKGVTWADGAPLTAKDWRFTWRAVMNDRNNTKLRYGWDNIAAVMLPDDYTIVIKLKVPDAGFLGNLATGGAAYPPLPEHLLGKLPDLNRATFNHAPLSSGPYILERWNHGASLEFGANPRYWRGRPKLDSVVLKVIPSVDTLFAQLLSHEIDVYPGVDENQIDRIRHLPGVVAQERLVANWRHLEFNTRQPELSDRRVRLAIAEAVDWDRINRTIYRGINVRAHSDIFPQSWAAPKIPLYRYDPNDSKALLARAGWVMGPDGVLHKGNLAMHVTISTGTNKQANEHAEVQMQADLKPLGIDLEIKNYPVSLLFAQNGPLYSGHYYMSWSIATNAADPDNEGSWSAQFMPPKGANTSFIDDPLITRLSHQAKQTFDRTRRKALYQKEEERIHELVPAVFLYWENQYSAWNSDVRNYKPAPFIANNWNSWQWKI